MWGCCEAWSNTDEVSIGESGGLKRSCFAATPRMSTYLLAFAIAPTDGPTISDLDDNGIALRYPPTPCPGTHVDASPSRLINPYGEGNGTAEGMLSVTKQAMKWMADFTGIAYPLKKYDQLIVSSQFQLQTRPCCLQQCSTLTGCT